MPVRQLRLVVTAADYDEAVHFYRDVLGLAEPDAVAPPEGRVMILDAGAAALEVAEPVTAEYIDQVEVGQVDDVRTSTDALAATGGVPLDELPGQRSGGPAAHALPAGLNKITGGLRPPGIHARRGL